MKSRVNSGTWRSEVKPKQMNWIKQDEIKHEEELEYMMFNVGSNPKKNPVLVEVVVDKAPLQMQVDIGASVCIISYSTYAALWENQPQIQNCPTKLRTYTGEEIEVVGKIIVTV